MRLLTRRGTTPVRRRALLHNGAARGAMAASHAHK
jgi:hypothetical protein